MMTDQDNTVLALEEALREIAALKEEIATLEHAAHMPPDYEYGLPSWINQRLYACYIGVDFSEHIQEYVQKLIDRGTAEAAALRQVLISIRKDVHFAHKTIDSEGKWDELCEAITRQIDAVTPNGTSGARLLARLSHEAGQTASLRLAHEWQEVITILAADTAETLELDIQAELKEKCGHPFWWGKVSVLRTLKDMADADVKRFS